MEIREEIEPTPDEPVAHHTGGGGKSDHLPDSRPEEQVHQLQEGERMLAAIGVRRSVAGQLATRDAGQIARVITLARARPDVRDLAAWVVSALRDLPEAEGLPRPSDERPPSVMPIYTHPSLTDEQRDRWIRRFRAAPSPYEQHALLTRLHQEHPRC
jgi:hypothetical protein